MIRSTFSCLGANVGVIAGPDMIGWLKARSCGFFDCSEATAAGSEWTISVDAEAASGGGWKLYRRPARPFDSACDFLVNATTRSIVIDLPPGPWRDLFVLRVIRNVLRWELLGRGAVFLHASCVERDGQGILILGPSRGGKTTTILSLISSGGWNYVTEDDLAIVPQPDGKLLALGWPGCLRIRREALQGHSWLKIAREEFRHPSNQCTEGSDSADPLLRVFPEELARIAGCGVTTAVAPSFCVWVNWDAGPQLDVIPSGDVLTRFTRSWDVLPERRPGARPDGFDLGSNRWADCVFDKYLLDFHGVPDMREQRLILERLSKEIPCFSYAHSGDASLLGTSLVTRHGPETYG